MELKNEALEVRLVVPDRPTVRDVLNYDSQRDSRFGAEIYERLWEAAKSIIKEFDCPHVALDIDLESAATSKALDVIRWVSLAVFSYRSRLDELEKNS